jgi:hypothetical protein
VPRRPRASAPRAARRCRPPSIPAGRAAGGSDAWSTDRIAPWIWTIGAGMTQGTRRTRRRPIAPRRTTEGTEDTEATLCERALGALSGRATKQQRSSDDRPSTGMTAPLGSPLRPPRALRPLRPLRSARSQRSYLRSVRPPPHGPPDDDRDVVRSATIERQLEQRARHLLRRLHRTEVRRDLRIGDVLR